MEIENQVPVLSMKSLQLPSDCNDIERRDVEIASTLLLNAARDWGFVYLKDHGVPNALLEELDALSRDFFNLPVETKLKIKMMRGGKAWRGYFPPGGELTSGIPDAKEGIYFGSDLSFEDPKVQSGRPLHGPNLWPEEIPKMKAVVTEYISRLKTLGHALMRGLAIGLKLDDDYFKRSFGKDPTILFRIFNYPETDQQEGWGVGEHTDYGFLTILKTDHHPGLQILSPDQTWIDAPPIEGTFIINLGDQLEIATNGLLKATPHRVKIQRNGDRLSWPFFFDPDWDSKLFPVNPEDSLILKSWLESGGTQNRQSGKRWDGRDLHTQKNSLEYGTYLMDKVSKCFPELFTTVVNS